MSDQFKLLPRFSWRGREYPILERSVSFSNEVVEHTLQRRNQSPIEPTASANPVLTYTLALREDLNKGPYVHLFTEGLQALYDDCRNRTEDELWDPIYGLVTCAATSYSETSDNNKRDGTDVKVEFKVSPDDDADFATTPTASAVTQDAQETAVEAQTFAQSENIADEIPPENQTSLTNLLSQASAFGRAVLATPNDVRSELNKISFWAKEIEDIVVTSVSPASVQVQNSARSTRDNANQALDNSAQVNPVRVVIVEAPSSATSLAAVYGVPVADLLAANPLIARRPIVQPGTSVVIPNAKS